LNFNKARDDGLYPNHLLVTPDRNHASTSPIFTDHLLLPMPN